MNPEQATTVSVIVPHLSDLQGLDDCLACLDQQTLPRDQFEVIVADNFSPEGPAVVEAVVSGRARLVVVNERGAGPARNGGAHAASGGILAFTDCDCRPDPEWLTAGVAALRRDDVVGGKVVVQAKDAAHPTPAEAFELVFAFDNESYVRKKGFTVSANLFCARPVFERVGGFGVGISEDVDWCHRAAAAGFTLGYEPSAVVRHPARRDWPELVRKWRRIDTESFGLIRADPIGRLRWMTRALALPLSAIVHAPRVLVNNRLPGPGVRSGALMILFRLRAWRFWDSLRLGLTGA